MTDLVVRHCGRLLTMDGDGLGVLTDAALRIDGGRVTWVGPDRELSGADAPELDAAGACVLPGFVDAHTHLVWAGSRQDELVARLAGTPYDGGGIHTTVAATTAASDDDLIALSLARALTALANGTTTIEVKTGYGLDPIQELRLLDVVAELAARTPQRVEATYLVHVAPPGLDRTQHVAETVSALAAAVEQGAAWCDVFCDRGAFTPDDTRAIFAAARQQQLGLRLHADQLSETGGAALAAECGCASADHLEHVTPAGARAMGAAGVVAVLLPTASLVARSDRLPDVDALRDAGVTLALGTDCNPGTSWCESMPYVVQLACFLYGLTVDEAVRAATRGAAASLRRDDVGRLSAGAWGDVVVLDADHEADLVGHLGVPAVRHVVVGGVPTT